MGKPEPLGGVSRSCENALVTEFSGSPDAEIFWTITLIYDHHTRLLPERPTELQHQNYGAILSTVHVRLDSRQLLEVVLDPLGAQEVHKPVQFTAPSVSPP